MCLETQSLQNIVAETEKNREHTFTGGARENADAIQIHPEPLLFTQTLEGRQQNNQPELGTSI